MHRHPITLLALALALTAFGIGDLERGNRLYREGRYAEAVTAYRAALEEGQGTPQLHYNLGTALLRLGEYDQAEPHLRRALQSVDPELRRRAFYNLGNRYLRAARGTERDADRAKLLDAAVQAYKRTLRLDPADAAAKWNLELALRERSTLPPRAGGSQGRQGPQQPPPPGAGAGGGAGGGDPTGGADRRGRDGAPGQAGMTREQAERILSAVEQNERELYRKRLRKGQRRTPVARDW